MTNCHRPTLLRSVLAFVLTAVLAFPPLVAAQLTDRPCAGQPAPDDGFRSRGIGLTTPELAALYGTAEVGQGSLIYDFDGLDLHQVGCDLIVTFPSGDTGDEQRHEFAIAESLLPDDAELVGTFALGTPIRSYAGNSLWRSPSLAARFAALGEPRGETILIVYTYNATLPGEPIERVELRTVALAE
jgi:hypothetical protein